MNASGSSRGPFAQSSSPPRAKAATSGTSRATRVAGGSTTVSEARSLAARGRQKRDDATVGVADEVVAVGQAVGDPDGVVLEVDAAAPAQVPD